MSPEQGRKFSRREFLVGAGALIGAAVAAEGARRVLFESESPLEKQIETEFNVRILTLRQLYGEKGLPYVEDDDPHRVTGLSRRDIPRRWHQEQLETLREFLLALPPHFHQPNSNGEKLGIILSNRDCQCGAPYNERKPYRAEMSYNRFWRGARKEDFPVFAHEATHVQTPVSGYTHIYTQLGHVTLEESPWYDALNRLFGNESYYFQTEAMVKARFLAVSEGKFPQLPQGRVATDEEQERTVFLTRLGDLYWEPFSFLKEFVAFLGENYVKGRPYFKRHFGELLTSQEYEGVYNFTKQVIFRGKEYPKHPFG